MNRDSSKIGKESVYGTMFVLNLFLLSMIYHAHAIVSVYGAHAIVSVYGAHV